MNTFDRDNDSWLASVLSSEKLLYNYSHLVIDFDQTSMLSETLFENETLKPDANYSSGQAFSL